MSKHIAMVVAAARAFNQRVADACGVDAEDQWKTHGEDFLEDANAMLEAAGAPELLEALIATRKALEVATTPLSKDRQEVLAATGLADSAIAKAKGEQA